MSVIGKKFISTPIANAITSNSGYIATTDQIVQVDSQGVITKTLDNLFADCIKKTDNSVELDNIGEFYINAQNIDVTDGNAWGVYSEGYGNFFLDIFDPRLSGTNRIRIEGSANRDFSEKWFSINGADKLGLGRLSIIEVDGHKGLFTWKFDDEPYTSNVGTIFRDSITTKKYLQFGDCDETDNAIFDGLILDFDTIESTGYTSVNITTPSFKHNNNTIWDAGNLNPSVFLTKLTIDKNAEVQLSDSTIPFAVTYFDTAGVFEASNLSSDKYLVYKFAIHYTYEDPSDSTNDVDTTVKAEVIQYPQSDGLWQELYYNHKTYVRLITTSQLTGISDATRLSNSFLEVNSNIVVTSTYNDLSTGVVAIGSINGTTLYAPEGGEGSSATVTPVVQSGTEIAQIDSTSIYIPSTFLDKSSTTAQSVSSDISAPNKTISAKTLSTGDTNITDVAYNGLNYSYFGNSSGIILPTSIIKCIDDYSPSSAMTSSIFQSAHNVVTDGWNASVVPANGDGITLSLGNSLSWNIPLVTTSAAGLMSAADKSTLDSLSDGIVDISDIPVVDSSTNGLFPSSLYSDLNTLLSDGEFHNDLSVDGYIDADEVYSDSITAETAYIGALYPDLGGTSVVINGDLITLNGALYTDEIHSSAVYNGELYNGLVESVFLHTKDGNNHSLTVGHINDTLSFKSKVRNVTIVTDNTTDTIATSGNTLLAISDNSLSLKVNNNSVSTITLPTYSNATSSTDGLMSSTDKAKLDSVPSSNIATSGNTSLSLNGTSIVLTVAGTLTSSVTIPTTYGVATTSSNGLMSSDDKTIFDMMSAKVGYTGVFDTDANIKRKLAELYGNVYYANRPVTLCVCAETSGTFVTHRFEISVPYVASTTANHTRNIVMCVKGMMDYSGTTLSIQRNSSQMVYRELLLSGKLVNIDDASTLTFQVSSIRNLTPQYSFDSDTQTLSITD